MRNRGVWAVAVRPRWVGALLLTLAVAVSFVLLSQWQISRAVEQAKVIDYKTETVVAIGAVAKPQSPVTTESNGHLVSVKAQLVPTDYSVISGRQQKGSTVFWVVGHAVTVDGASLAVALGWQPTREKAQDAADALATQPAAVTGLRGRYLVSEAATDDDFEKGERRTMAVATLINEWQTAPVTAYGGFLVLSDAPAELQTIDSPAQKPDVTLNWLNVFYAAEWVIFAGFAFYMWFRLVRDEWEREQQEQELLAEPN